MSNDVTTQAGAGHAAYLAETRQLVDEQTEALFSIVAAILAHASHHDSVARHARVSHQAHTLTVTNGPCSETFTVTAISDLPDSADRMRLFPMSQARCLVQATDGSTAEWLLKRDNTGDVIPVYAWMPARSDTRVGEPEIHSMLRQLLDCTTL